MSEKSVKLKVYQTQGDKTYIDTIEAESFDSFVLVAMPDMEVANTMTEELIQMFPNKKIIVVPKEWDISFYGVEVDNDDRPTDS